MVDYIATNVVSIRTIFYENTILVKEFIKILAVKKQDFIVIQ
jgi:hypothetical protein